MRKLLFYFKWFDSWYRYLRLNKFFRILAENFKHRCQYCILRVETNNFRKDIFYWNELSISIYFKILRKKILDIQRKKIKTFRTAFNMSGGQILWKNVFLDSLQFTTFVQTVTETHSKVRLKILLWVLQTARTCPNERLERNDFLSSVPNSNFFQTLSRKNPAVLWKPISTRPDELMKNEVLIRSSLVPKIFFGIWRRYFRSRFKQFSMVGDTAFYASKERIEQKIFRNNFVSQWLPGFECNLL